MAYGLKLWFTATLILFVLKSPKLVSCETNVPCYFVFGDSLFDNGNNNELQTIAKANYPPYGVDFADGPTGRFTNGRNMADVIAEHLGFDEYIPPFATAKGDALLKGVNYASGGAGILYETGRHLGDVIYLGAQLNNHNITVGSIAGLKGDINSTNEYLRRCIYSVGLGNNDYINNYFMPEFYSSSSDYTPKQYATMLIHQYAQYLRILYTLGARKVVVFGVGEIGCIPMEVSKFGTNGSACVEKINRAVQPFNHRLKSLVHYLNTNLRDSNFIFLNITSITSSDPNTPGLEFTITPCCNVSTEYAKQCIPNNIPCANRAQHVFWDSFHPTEIANVAVAARAFNAQSPFDAYPFDIQNLVKIN